MQQHVTPSEEATPCINQYLMSQEDSHNTLHQHESLNKQEQEQISMGGAEKMSSSLLRMMNSTFIPTKEGWKNPLRKNPSKTTLDSDAEIIMQATVITALVGH